MARGLAALALLLTLCFALALVAFRLPSLGAAPAARLDTCDAPCWEGIQPGITTRTDALDRLTRSSGVEPSLAPCYNANNPLACDLYQWKLPDEIAIRTGMQVEHETVRLITAQSPDLTLGDALLMLRQYDLPLYEIQVGYSVDTLTLWLGFSNASVRLSASSPCPTTYRDLMHTSLARIVFQEPEPPRPLIPATFSLVRETVYQLCER
jgi:hypothetical protein